MKHVVRGGRRLTEMTQEEFERLPIGNDGGRKRPWRQSRYNYSCWYLCYFYTLDGPEVAYRPIKIVS